MSIQSQQILITYQQSKQISTNNWMNRSSIHIHKDSNQQRKKSLSKSINALESQWNAFKSERSKIRVQISPQKRSLISIPLQQSKQANNFSCIPSSVLKQIQPTKITVHTPKAITTPHSKSHLNNYSNEKNRFSSNSHRTPNLQFMQKKFKKIHNNQTHTLNFLNNSVEDAKNISQAIPVKKKIKIEITSNKKALENKQKTLLTVNRKIQINSQASKNKIATLHSNTNKIDRANLNKQKQPNINTLKEIPKLQINKLKQKTHKTTHFKQVNLQNNNQKCLISHKVYKIPMKNISKLTGRQECSNRSKGIVKIYRKSSRTDKGHCKSQSYMQIQDIIAFSAKS